MTKVLMVCLGNICRSPLAEGILTSMVDPNYVYVDSAGTAAYHVGERPDARSIVVARNNNIDITGQRARKLTKVDIDQFDHIFVMDKTNHRNVLAMAKDETTAIKIKLILEGGREVPDPYYGGADGFEKVFDMLHTACQKIVDGLH